MEENNKFRCIYCIEVHGYKKGKGRKARGEQSLTRRYARNKKVAEKVAKSAEKHYYPGARYTTIRKTNKYEWQFIRPEWVEE